MKFTFPPITPTLSLVDQKFIDNLRAKGFAVVTLSPRDLKQFNPRHMEGELIRHAKENLIQP